MTQNEVLDELRSAGALLEGHFILSSGLHSPVFLQKMFVFQDPARTERVCRALAEKIRDAFGAVDYVVSPAVGGIVPGYETARHLGCKAIFVERENGVFVLRRGFTIPEGARRRHGRRHRHDWTFLKGMLGGPAEHPGTSSALPASSTAPAARPTSAFPWFPWFSSIFRPTHRTRFRLIWRLFRQPSRAVAALKS